MKNILAFTVVYICLAGPSAWAIDCMSAPGNPKDGWYAWREIDGRKCWFKKTGDMPPKSQLHWPAKAEREPPPREPVLPPPERTTQAPEKITPPLASSPEKTLPVPALRQDDAARPQSQSGTVSHVTVIPVRPSTAGPRVQNGQTELMNGASQLNREPLGGARQQPARLAPADPFEARFNAFTGKRD
jgi:hypothetical protein